MTAVATAQEKVGRVPSDLLVEIIRRSAPSPDVTRAHIRSLHFEGGQIISTDGHRMHRLHRLPAAAPVPDCTVPLWTLQAALASIEGSTGAVTIDPRADRVVVSTTEGSVSAAQPKFVPWRLVHPELAGHAGAPAIELELKINEARRELTRLAKAGGGVAISGVHYLPADPAARRKVLRFSARTEHGSALADAARVPDWDVTAPDLWNGQIGFLNRYLLEALAAAKWSLRGTSGTSKATLKIWGPTDAALLVWDGGDAVIMPMRI